MDMDAPARPKRSAWSILGCTCGLIIVLAIGAVTILTWMTYREARSIKAALRDPKARVAKTREVLPFETLPEGYYALGSFSIPLIAQMAFFGDREPGLGEEPNRGMVHAGFIFMSLRQVRDNKQEMVRYLKGEEAGKRPDWVQRNADFEAGDPIGRGQITVRGVPVYYFASRGAVKQPKGKLGGLLNLVLADCPNDSRIRFGVWLGPDPAPEKPVAELEVKGTNADPAALQDFLGHFQLCPAGH